MLGQQTFLWDKFAICTNNDKCMEEIWKKFKEVVHESLEHFVLHKLLRKNPDTV
jgi:hypothetical protein